MCESLGYIKKLIKKLEKYPEEIQSVLYDVYLEHVTNLTVYTADKLYKKYPTYPILSCVAGLSEHRIKIDNDYQKISCEICYNYLKQFNPELFEDN